MISTLLRPAGRSTQRPVLLWVADASGEPESFSRAALEYLGLEPSELAVGGWFWAVHPCDLRGVLRAWEQAVRSGNRFQATFRLRRADGAYRRHRALATPEKDAAGQVQRWSGSWTDVDRAEQAAGAA